MAFSDHRFTIGHPSSAPVQGSGTTALPDRCLSPAIPTTGDIRLIALADLHSPYRTLAPLLQAVRESRQCAATIPTAIVINGDIFERGNVAALRSSGVADWRFMAALADEAPLIVNLGNHETALIDDLAEFVAQAENQGAIVIGNISDRRTGRPFAPAATRLTLGDHVVGFLGLAATNPMVYRDAVRDDLELPEPVAHTHAAFDAAMAGADVPVILSHAGVVADRAILPALPDGTLMIGGHDHLRLDHRQGGTRYVHCGSWGDAVTVIDIAIGRHSPVHHVSQAPITVARAADPDLMAVINDVLDRHLTDGDKQVIADISPSQELGQNLGSDIRFAVEAVRQAAEADVAFLGHTAFGAGITVGPLTRYDFDAFLRFDGAVETASISGETLAAIMAGANQDRARSLDAFTGDFVYAGDITIDPEARYRIATNDWIAMNQRTYLGTEGIAFQPIDGLRLKPIVERALRQCPPDSPPSA